MKRCTHCRKEIPDHLDHCIYCGWDFDTTEEAVTSEIQEVDEEPLGKTGETKNERTHQKKKKKKGKSKKKKASSLWNQPWFILLLLLFVFPLGIVLALKNKRYYDAPKSTLYATSFGILFWIQLYCHYRPTDDILLILELWILLGMLLIILWFLTAILQLSIHRSFGYAAFTIVAICVNAILLLGPLDIDYTKLMQLHPLQIWDQTQKNDDSTTNSASVHTEKPKKNPAKKQEPATTTGFTIHPGELGQYGVLETVDGNEEIHYYLKEGTYRVSLKEPTTETVDLTLYEDGVVKKKLTIRSASTNFLIEKNQYFTLDGTTTIQFERND